VIETDILDMAAFGPCEPISSLEGVAHSGAELEVRIQSPPAESQQTFGSCSRAPPADPMLAERQSNRGRGCGHQNDEAAPAVQPTGQALSSAVTRRTNTACRDGHLTIRRLHEGISL
jgi:hypothetical protein